MKDGRHVPAFNVLRYLTRVLLAVFSVSAILLATPPTPSQAQAPHITLTPDSGPPGSMVTVSGTDFLPQYPVTITMGSSVIASGITAATNGTFSVTGEVPLLPVGAKTVTASAADGKITASAMFNVLPHIDVIPPSGVAESTVTITGSGFLPQYQVAITIGGSFVANVMTGANAAFSVSVRVPLLPPGEKAVVATASVYSASASFVIPPPQVSVTPHSGVPSSTLTITGSGFPAASSATVTIDGRVVVSGVTVTRAGTFSAKGPVPLVTPGGKKVLAEAGGTSATDVFTVLPIEIHVTPVSGVAGSTITITGSGFPASSPIMLTMDNNALGPVRLSTDATGTFSTSATVPQLPPGEKAVTAVAGTVRSSTSFSILSSQLPQIVVTPRSGVPGSSIAIEGAGFPPLSSATITMDRLALTPVRTNAEGGFSTTTTVPQLPPGSKAVTATAGTARASTSFEVRASEVPIPDLAISSVDYWFEDDEQILVLSVQISNQGNAVAPNTEVAAIEPGLGTAGTSPVPSLGPAETVPVEIRLDVTGEQRGTSRILTVEVYPGNSTETNKENNRQTIEVWVPGVGEGIRWYWIIIIVVATIGVAYSVWKVIPRPRPIEIRPHKDIGSQEMVPGTSTDSDYEIRLRPVSDPGKQDIEVAGSLIADERRERHG